MFKKNRRRFAVKEFPITFGHHGIKLNGKVLLPKDATIDNPVPGVVLCHGFGAGHRVMEPSARIMARQGVATIVFDLRGHGDSGGAIDGGMAEDVIDAWDVLTQFPEVDRNRIGLAGHSLGALSSVMAAEVVRPRALAALSCPPEISDQSVVAESADVGKWGRENGGIAEYPRKGAFPWLTGLTALFCRVWMYLGRFHVLVDWQRFSEVLHTLKMSEVLPKLADCSKLFVFCEGDTVTPYEKTVLVYETACEPRQKILARGGIHTTPLLPGKLRAQWTNWMVETLSNV